jgi:hypothetical protein
VKYTSKPDVTAVRTSSKPENHPLDLCGVFDCVPLFPFPKSISYRGMASFDKVKGKDRFVIADVGGKPVVIYISAPTAGKAHEFFRRRGRC